MRLNGNVDTEPNVADNGVSDVELRFIMDIFWLVKFSIRLKIGNIVIKSVDEATEDRSRGTKIRGYRKRTMP